MTLRTTAISLGFSKVTALLGVLPSICNCTFPPGSSSSSICGLTGDRNGNESLPSRPMKRIYLPVPGSVKAARKAARKKREDELMQEVCKRHASKKAQCDNTLSLFSPVHTLLADAEAKALKLIQLNARVHTHAARR